MMTGHDDGGGILSARDVTVRYGPSLAVDQVDIDLKRGCITAILGPSGAGKSTLLRAIAGFQPLAGGRIEQRGQILSSAGQTVPPELRRMGIVVQNLALFPHLTAFQNVAFGLTAKDRKDAAMHWLHKIGLADRAAAYPHELSGGEQQRIALARALAPEPSVILLDEAFSSLDPQLRRSLRRETETLLRESCAAVLMVTHDPDEAMELADQLIVMAEGRVLQRGSPDALYWRPANRMVAELLGEANIFSGICGDGYLPTPFGRLQDKSLRAGAAVAALIRPSAVTMRPSDAANAARVSAVSFMGPSARVTLTASSNEKITLLVSTSQSLSIGDRVMPEFQMDRVSFLPDD